MIGLELEEHQDFVESLTRLKDTLQKRGADKDVRQAVQDELEELVDMLEDCPTVWETPTLGECEELVGKMKMNLEAFQSANTFSVACALELAIQEATT